MAKKRHVSLWAETSPPVLQNVTAGGAERRPPGSAAARGHFARGALWGQPPAAVPPGDRAASALRGRPSSLWLTVAKEARCTTARHSTRFGSGAPGLLGVGLGSPNPPHHARDTPCAETALPPRRPLLGGLCGGVGAHLGPEEGGAAGLRGRRTSRRRLPFGLRPKPASVETAAGRAPAARPRGCFTSGNPHSASPHPSGPPAPPPRPRPRLRRLLSPGIWVPADHTLLPGSGLARLPEPPWSVSTRQGGALDLEPAPPTPPGRSALGLGAGSSRCPALGRWPTPACPSSSRTPRAMSGVP